MCRLSKYAIIHNHAAFTCEKQSETICIIDLRSKTRLLMRTLNVYEIFLTKDVLSEYYLPRFCNSTNFDHQKK